MKAVAAAVTFLVGLGAVPGVALAQVEHTGDVLLAAGASFRHATGVDLAAIGGSTDFGSGNDASPGSLSVEIGAGMLFPFPLELRTSAWLGVGGLALSDVERRYFAGGPEQIGSSLTIGAAGSVRYAPLVTSDLRLLVGPAADWKRLAAASPLGSAHLDLVGVGLDAGARWRAGRVSRHVDGHLELVLGARRELPAALWVGRSRSDVLLRGVAGSADPIYSFGVSLAYVFSFNDAL